MGLISLWDFTYSGAEHFQTMVNRLPDVDYLIRTAHWATCLEDSDIFELIQAILLGGFEYAHNDAMSLS